MEKGKTVILFARPLGFYIELRICAVDGAPCSPAPLSSRSGCAAAELLAAAPRGSPTGPRAWGWHGVGTGRERRWDGRCMSRSHLLMESPHHQGAGESLFGPGV